MNWKDFIKDFYEEKVYNDQDVAGFIKTGQLTATDYQDITGKEYIENTAN